MIDAAKDQPFLVRDLAHAWVKVITDSSSLRDETLVDQLCRALDEWGMEGVGLVDIRLASAPTGDYGTEQVVILIGRTADV